MSNYKELENSLSSDPNSMYINEEDDTLSMIQQLQENNGDDSLMSEVFSSMINDPYSDFVVMSQTDSHIRIIDGYINLDEPELVEFLDDNISIASHQDYLTDYDSYYSDIMSMDSYESVDGYIHSLEYDNTSYEKMKSVATSTVFILGTLFLSAILF